MSYPIDPMRTKYWPEVFGEAGSATTTSSGVELVEYSGYSDYIVQLVDLATTHAQDGSSSVMTSAVRVNSDSGDNLINSMMSARGHIDNAIPQKITGVKSLGVYGYYPSGGAAELMRYRLGVRVTKPTVFEKILYKMSLTETEKVLDAKFDVAKKIRAGVLTGHTDQHFTKIYEVAKSITAASGANPTIGAEIHPLAGQKAVLLGIATEEHATASQVYISVNRENEQVMKLDAYAFENKSVHGTNYIEELNYEQSVYVVALDKLKVWIENTGSAITDFKVRFRYGIAPLTIIEKIRWGLEMTDEEKMVATEFDLFDGVLAGVF